ncbi:hypothetical protein DL98DRAFT_521119 [Cadophora sp. DSE1049]|nr:hypothetical protein DL98DRAFT_521119 [Cadophora sp. DSE1049]
MGVLTSKKNEVSTPQEHRIETKYLLLGKFIGITISITLFSVSLGYTLHMVLRLHSLHAIDIHGWSFGQVVAAMFWIPVFLDVEHSVFADKKHVENNGGSDLPQGGPEKKRTLFWSCTKYAAVPKNNTRDEDVEDGRRQSPSNTKPSAGPRKRSMPKRKTIRMEEGQ